VPFENGGRDAHGGQRAFHVAHAEPIEASITARKTRDGNRPGGLVAGFHGVHVRIEDDMAAAGTALDAANNIGSLIVGRDFLGRDAVAGQVGVHDLGWFVGATRRIDTHRRHKPSAQLDQFLPRRIDVATNRIGQAAAHVVLRWARTSSGRRPTMLQ
jgi:hypothetical protein